MEPQGCHAQAVFTSNLHSFWKVADTLQAEETNDEGLLALVRRTHIFQYSRSSMLSIIPSIPPSHIHSAFQ